jgi:HEAT repeat protein
MRIASGLAALTCLACTSSAARQAKHLYDRGDYAGAAQLADSELVGRPGDDDLWNVRIRALLAQGDGARIAGDYAKYVQARGGDDPDLVIDMATATLDQGLDSMSVDVRIQTIGFIEDLALEPLAEDVMDQMESEDDRIAAAAAVAVLRGHPQAPYLLEQLQHSDDPHARAIAIEGIGRKVGKHADDDLRKAAADPDPRVRVAAMIALGGIFDEVSTRSLGEALADPDATVRAAAARSLADRRRGDLAGFARKALADESAAVRLGGVAILAAGKDTAGLQALLGGDDPVIAVQAAAALEGADPAGAAQAVDAALARSESAVRVGAVNLMEAALGKAAAFERAHRLLADADLAVRLAAARVLAYQKHAAEAIPVFAAALDGTERLSAAADLARLGDARGVATLSAALQSAKRPADRVRAAQMHGSAHRITPGLVAALADQSGQVRVVAAYYLIKIARNEQVASDPDA